MTPSDWGYDERPEVGGPQRRGGGKGLSGADDEGIRRPTRLESRKSQQLTDQEFLDRVKSADGAFTIDPRNKRILMGSATEPITGVGIFIGLDDPDYEWRAGDPDNDFIHWDGSSLSITGSLTATTGTIGGWDIGSDELSKGNVKLQSTAERILMGSATAPLTGTGVFMGLDGSDYEFRVGDPSADYIHWDGSSWLVTAKTVIVTRARFGHTTDKQVSGGPSYIETSDAAANQVSHASFVDGDQAARFVRDIQGNHEWEGPEGLDQNVLLGWTGLGRLGLRGVGEGGLSLVAWKHSQLSSAVDDTTTSFPVLDSGPFSVGDRTRIEDEICSVDGIPDGTTLTVSRGQEGTTAVSHAKSSKISVLGTSESQARIILNWDGSGITFTDGKNASNARLKLADPDFDLFAFVGSAGGGVGVAQDDDAFQRITLENDTQGIKFSGGSAAPDVKIQRTAVGELTIDGGLHVGDPTLTVDGTQVLLATRTISTGDGLTGGGDLTADRTLAVDLETDGGLAFTTAQLGVDEANVDHDALSGFVANEHVDHSAVSISGGSGLSGGGDITASRTLALNHLGLEDLSDPNADRIIFWDDSSGATAWLTPGTGLSITTTSLDVGGLTDSEIAAGAEIAVAKLADGTARQLLQTDAAGTGVEWTSNIDVPGTLDVTGAAQFDNTVTFAWPGQNYEWGRRSTVLTLQGQKTATPVSFELYTLDGDGTDDTRFTMRPVGTPGNITNRESMQLFWNSGSSRYEILTAAGGTGTVRPLHLYTGSNTSQLVLNTDGSISTTGAATLDTGASGSSFGGDLTVSGSSLLVGSSTDASYGPNGLIQVSGITPGFTWHDSDAGADEGVYNLYNAGGVLNGTASNDAGNSEAFWLRVFRTGTTVDEVRFPGTKVTVSGDLTVDSGATGAGSVFGGATGGAQGAGTINAVGVYDDGSILTDYVLDLALDGETAHDVPGWWDGPWSMADLHTVVHEERRLPWMQTRKEWQKDRSLGHTLSRLWAGQEMHALYLLDHDARLTTLETREERLERALTEIVEANPDLPGVQKAAALLN